MFSLLRLQKLLNFQTPNMFYSDIFTDFFLALGTTLCWKPSRYLRSFTSLRCLGFQKLTHYYCIAENMQLAKSLLNLIFLIF